MVFFFHFYKVLFCNGDFFPMVIDLFYNGACFFFLQW